MWAIDEALRLVRAIQPETRQFGYHLCLGGGVLNNGKSEKDVDLYFLPMDNGGKIRVDDLKRWLEEMWGKSEEIGGDYTDELAGIPDDTWTTLMRTQEPMWQLREAQNPIQWVQKEPIPRPMSAYKYKLKFIRPDGERIDVFIV